MRYQLWQRRWCVEEYLSHEILRTKHLEERKGGLTCSERCGDLPSLLPLISYTYPARPLGDITREKVALLSTWLCRDQDGGRWEEYCLDDQRDWAGLSVHSMLRTPPNLQDRTGANSTG